MNESAFKNLITSTITSDVKVWADFVPEQREKPAISYSHITSGSSRALNGNKINAWDSWRILAVGEFATSQSQELIDELRLMDNTSNDDFKNVFVISEGGIPVLPDDKIKASFIDVRTYDK